MKATKLIACLLLASAPFLLAGCFGALASAGVKAAAQGVAVKSATLGHQPGMIETAQQSAEAVKIMSRNTSAQGEAIRYIDNPVDERRPHAVDPLGRDRAKLNTLQDNLQYLEGLRNKPRHKGDKDLDRRIADIKGRIRGIYIDNGQKPPPHFGAVNDASRDAMQDSMRSGRDAFPVRHAPSTPSIPSMPSASHPET